MQTKTLFISAGHSDADPGAAGNGYTEAGIVLEFRDFLVMHCGLIIQKCYTAKNNDTDCSMKITKLQTDLAARGLYTDRIDGDWGRNTEAAYRELLERADACAPAPSADGMAWGAKVSGEFKAKVRSICDRLGIPDPSALMACMAWESAETFSPDIRNMAGSGATGLIQFMPATARGLGTTTDKLAVMTAIDQLDYVEKYFQPYKGRMKNLGDIYMAILWPRGIGKPDDWALWDRASRPTTYRQNAGLDLDGDGVIIRAEAVAKVREKLNKGMKAPYYG